MTLNSLIRPPSRQILVLQHKAPGKAPKTVVRGDARAHVPPFFGYHWQCMHASMQSCNTREPIQLRKS